MTVNRENLIQLLHEAQQPKEAIDKALSEKGYEPLTEAEMKAYGILPEVVTADDVLSTKTPPPEGGEVSEDKVKAPMMPLPAFEGVPDLPLPPSPGDGQHSPDSASWGEDNDGYRVAHIGPKVGEAHGIPVHAWEAHIIALTANMGKLLATVDPDAHKQYKELKAPGTRPDKAKAYLFAFRRLLQLGYIPNG